MRLTTIATQMTHNSTLQLQIHPSPEQILRTNQCVDGTLINIFYVYLLDDGI